MICLAAGGAVAAQQLRVWTAGAMDRVFLQSGPPPSGGTGITIRACRNEWESAQVVVQSSAATLSRLSYRIAVPGDAAFPPPAVFQVLDVPVRKSSPHAPLKPGLYPDALVPLAPGCSPSINTFRGRKGKVNLRLWLDFRVPAEMNPGSYTFVLTVADPDNPSLTGKAEITVEVLPETLPAKPTLRSFFGLEEHRIARIHGLDRVKQGIELARVMDRYYQLLADARLQPGLVFATSPPVGQDGRLVWSRPPSATLPAPADVVRKYFGSTGPFNVFHLPMWGDYPFADPLGENRAQAVAYLAELARLAHRTAPRAELVFSVGQLDEPDTEEAYRHVREWSALVRAAAAKAGTPVKFFVTEQPRPQNPEWGSLVGSVDIWAPHVMWAWEDLESKAGGRLIRRRIQDGDDVWCYPALAQFRDRWQREMGTPNMAGDSCPPVWLTDYPPVHYRVLPWICAVHGMTGMHYWNTFEWPPHVDPWEDNGSFLIGDGTFNGDGLLIYPPAPARLVGSREAARMRPCSSVRLKWIRDGVEDYGHLQILRKKNPAAAARVRARVARGFADWQTSPDAMVAARAMITEALKKTDPNN